MKAQLREFIFQELIFVTSVEDFSNDDNLLEAGLDSMGIMRLIIFIEDKFNVTLPDTEIDPDNVESINTLEKWIIRHQS